MKIKIYLAAMSSLDWKYIVILYTETQKEMSHKPISNDEALRQYLNEVFNVPYQETEGLLKGNYSLELIKTVFNDPGLLLGEMEVQ